MVTHQKIEGLEATNRYVKEDELENNRHGLTQFLNKLLPSVVKTRSDERNSQIKVEVQDDLTKESNRNIKKYCKEPSIELSG
jgi:hypothetical protein